MIDDNWALLLETKGTFKNIQFESSSRKTTCNKYVELKTSRNVKWSHTEIYFEFCY